MSKKVKNSENRQNQSRQPQKSDNALSVIFLIMVALTPLVAVYGHKYGYTPDLHMASWLHVMSMLLIAVFFWRKKTTLRGKPELQMDLPINSTLLLPLLLLMGWMLISSLWATTASFGLIKLLDWGSGLLGLLILYWTCQQQKQIELFFSIIYYSSLAVAVVGILQHIAGFDGLLQASPPGSFFSNKNRAAQYILLTWPLGVYLWLNCRSKVQHYFYAISMALILSYIIYTTTRAAWISVLVQLLIIAVVMVLKGKALLQKLSASLSGADIIRSLLLAILVFMLMVMTGPDGFQLSNILNVPSELGTINNELDAGRDGSLRIIMWLNTWEMIKDNWLLGVGYGNWLVMYPVYHQAAIADPFMTYSSQHNNAHNDYVELFAELGIIGIGLLIWLGIKTKLMILKILSSQYWLYGLILLTALAGVAIDSLFSFPLQKTVPIYMFVLLLGAVIVVYQLLPDSSSDNIKNKPYNIVLKKININIIIVFTAITSGLLMVNHYYWYIAEVNKRQAIRAAAKNDYEKVLEHSLRSYQYNPWQEVILNTVAVAYQQLGDIEKATETLELSFQRQPNTIYNLFNAADFYLKMKQYEPARKHLGHLVSIRPQDYHTQQIYAKLLFYIYKDKKLAAQHLRLALTLTEDKAQRQEIQQLLLKAES